MDRLTEAHVKQVLNYLATAKLEVGLLVNFGSDSLEWQRVVLSRPQNEKKLRIEEIDLKAPPNNSRPFA